MVWFIIKKPKNTRFRWVGPGPPDMENLPPGLDRGDVEANRLMHKYGHDPRMAQGQSFTRSLSRTEMKHGFKVPPGGAWLITPREMMEEKAQEEGGERIIDLHDLGTSFVLEAKAKPEDIVGAKFQVSEDSVGIFIPSGNLWLYGVRMGRDEDGNRLLQVSLHDDVIPSRSWIDLWDGTLRVNMPIDTLYTSDGVNRKELTPVVRNEPPPDLPEVPDHQKNKPSIYALRVQEHEGTFEVTISTEHQVRTSFRYELEPNVLKIYFEEVRKKTTNDGLVIRAIQHKYYITLPSTVLQDSANHRLEGDTFHIYLHKG